MAPKGAAPDVDIQSEGLRGVTVLLAAALAVMAGYALLKQDPLAADTEISVLASSIHSLLWACWRILQLLSICAFLLLLVLVARQRSLIYMPAPPGLARSPKENFPQELQNPKMWGMPYEDLTIETADGVKLNAWLVYLAALRDDEVPYTILFFHGNAGNIGHRLENIHGMWDKLRVNVLIVDYRGYGDSEDGGGPSEQGILEDACAAYRYLVFRIQKASEKEHIRMAQSRILIFGRSIGGAVAIRLFAHLQREQGLLGALPLPAGLVLENTFTSLRTMAVQLFPFLAILRPLLRPPLLLDPWDSLSSLQFIVDNAEDWCCCLFSGEMDTLVPPIQMRQIYDVLRTRRPRVLKFVKIKNGGHNDTPQKGGKEYWDIFAKFIGHIESDTASKSEAPDQAEH